MNKPRALVVEDDERLVEPIRDVLGSLGHEFDHVTNQQDALARIEAAEYDYLLLDLQIPARPKRGGASHEFGVHTLQAIRERRSAKQLPVIIMTAHHDRCVDHTKELIGAGATDFIAKPFPETGRTLAVVVRQALNGGRAARPQTDLELRSFDGGTMKFSDDRVELLGETIAEKSERANFWPVLQMLKNRRDDGRFMAYRGLDLAKKFKGPNATENTVSSCVGDLRKKITAAMASHGLKCGAQDVVMSGGPGYRLNAWIVVEQGNGDIAGTRGDRDMSNVTARKTDVPATPANVPLNERQHWALDQIRTGVKLRRLDVERQFKIVAKTAKRDLSDLADRGLIVFQRTPRPGHYRLAKK